MSSEGVNNYRFSSEELQVLRECNSESFFQRSLPIASTFSVATYWIVKKGYIKPNATFGAIPKIIVSFTIGYFLGKFSYQQKCAEKLMKLPNSRLGEILRRRNQKNLNLSAGLTLPAFNTNEIDRNDALEENSRDSNLLNENWTSPSIDMYSQLPNSNVEDELPVAKTTTSYEQLRQLNRDKYLTGQNSQFIGLDKHASDQHQHEKWYSKGEETSKEFLVKSKTNKYGDNLEN